MSASGDMLFSNLPELEPSGLNWAIWELQFWTAIRGKNLWGHFNGSLTRPLETLPKPLSIPPSISSPGADSSSVVDLAAAGPSKPPKTSALPKDTLKPVPILLLGTAGKIVAWDHNENLCRALLAQQLLNSTFIIIDKEPTVEKMWMAVKKKYTY